VLASVNFTPCLRTLADSFRQSHSKAIAAMPLRV
jgi:hypothetical protein